MTLGNLFRCSAAALIGFVFTTATAAAQDASFTVEVHNQTATLGPGGFAEFKMQVRNNTGSPLRLSVVRTINQRPDSTWKTSICYDDLCFIDTLSYPPPFELKAAQTRYLKLNVEAGMELQPGMVCHVVMEVSSLTGEAVQKEFDVTAAVSSVTDPTSLRAGAAYPNPARSVLNIPMPSAAARAHGLSLKIYDARGLQVADLSDMARGSLGTMQVDVSNMPSGAFRYVLDVDGERRTEPFVIAH